MSHLKERLQRLKKELNLPGVSLEELKTARANLGEESYQATIPNPEDILECPLRVAAALCEELKVLVKKDLRSARVEAEVEDVEERIRRGEIPEKSISDFSIPLDHSTEPEQLSVKEILNNERELLSKGLCPDCHSPVEFQSGCVLCRSCGYSKCG